MLRSGPPLSVFSLFFFDPPPSPFCMIAARTISEPGYGSVKFLPLTHGPHAPLQLMSFHSSTIINCRVMRGRILSLSWRVQLICFLSIPI